jgi:hypothetical protein
MRTPAETAEVYRFVAAGDVEHRRAHALVCA